MTKPDKEAIVLEQFKLYDTPNTMKMAFESILSKYPNKPIWVIVWKNEPHHKRDVSY